MVSGSEKNNVCPIHDYSSLFTPIRKPERKTRDKVKCPVNILSGKSVVEKCQYMVKVTVMAVDDIGEQNKSGKVKGLCCDIISEMVEVYFGRVVGGTIVSNGFWLAFPFDQSPWGT